MAMQIEVLKDEGSKIYLHLKGANIALVNALRRAIISDLPTFAIDEIDFYENNSAMFNDYIANRLAQIPLTYEDSLAEDVRIPLTLNAEGPCMVYSRDLKSADEKITVFNEEVPIMKLAADQRLRVEAFAIKGIGKTHAKFQSAIASYSAYPVMKKSKGASHYAASIAACPKKIINGKAELENPEKCDFCYACVEADPEGTLDIEQKDGEFVFFVESYNNISAREQLERVLSLIERGLHTAGEKDKPIEKEKPAAFEHPAGEVKPAEETASDEKPKKAEKAEKETASEKKAEKEASSEKEKSKSEKKKKEKK